MKRTILKKRFALTILTILTAALFVGCATTSEPMLTSEQLAEKGIDEAALRRGRALAVTECAACHRFHWPSEYSPEEWPPIVKKMGKRSSLDKKQISELEAYMVTMSGMTRNK